MDEKAGNRMGQRQLHYHATRNDMIKIIAIPLKSKRFDVTCGRTLTPHKLLEGLGELKCDDDGRIQCQLSGFSSSLLTSGNKVNNVPYNHTLNLPYWKPLTLEDFLPVPFSMPEFLLLIFLAA